MSETDLACSSSYGLSAHTLQDRWSFDMRCLVALVFYISPPSSLYNADGGVSLKKTGPVHPSLCIRSPIAMFEHSAPLYVRNPLSLCFKRPFLTPAEPFNSCPSYGLGMLSPSQMRHTRGRCRDPPCSRRCGIGSRCDDDRREGGTNTWPTLNH